MYNRKTRRELVLAAGAVLIMLPTTLALGEFEYAVFVAKGLDDFSTRAWCISNNGILAGNSWPSGQAYHPWACKASHSLDLGTFGGASGEAWGVNDDGTVVGWALNDLGDRRAFVWTRRDGMIDLGTFGGDGAVAYDVNDDGHVVGVAAFPGNYTGHAFLWNGVEKIDLGSLDNSLHSTARGVNSSGVVVGSSENAAGATRSVMWKDGEIIDLGSFGGDGNQDTATAINDLNQVVGYSRGVDRVYQPFLWEDGVLKSLSPSGGLAYDINNRSQVVGSRGGNAFVWEQGSGARLLRYLIPPKTGIELDLATGITDSGLISAWGPDPDSCQNCARSFLLVPVIPQITLSEPVPGVAGQVNTWTVTEAKPGAEITFAYSLKGGGTLVPGCNMQTAVLQLQNPIVMGNAIADDHGVAKLEMYVPEQARDVGEILFQAVRIAGCAESPLVVFDFE